MVIRYWQVSGSSLKNTSSLIINLQNFVDVQLLIVHLRLLGGPMPADHHQLREVVLLVQIGDGRGFLQLHHMKMCLPLELQPAILINLLFLTRLPLNTGTGRLRVTFLMFRVTGQHTVLLLVSLHLHLHLHEVLQLDGLRPRTLPLFLPLVVLLVEVTLLELLHQIENSLNVLAIVLLLRRVHVALHGLKFRELEDQPGQIYINHPLRLISLINCPPFSSVTSWWS